MDADALAEQIKRKANAEAEAILAKAQAEAKAIQMKLEAEAEGKKKLLAEAKGFEAMVKAAERNPEIAIQYKMVDQWKEIASEQVKAFEHIQLGMLLYLTVATAQRPISCRMWSAKWLPHWAIEESFPFHDTYEHCQSFLERKCTE